MRAPRLKLSRRRPDTPYAPMRRLAWLLGVALLGSALTKWIVVSMASDEVPTAECATGVRAGGYAAHCDPAPSGRPR